jgi:hypothetical protein
VGLPFLIWSNVLQNELCLIVPAGHVNASRTAATISAVITTYIIMLGCGHVFFAVEEYDQTLRERGSCATCVGLRVL